MHEGSRIFAMGLALLCLGTSCSTASTVRSGLESGEGVSRIYQEKSYDQVYSAALRVMNSRRFVLTGESKDRGLIEGEVPASFSSWGEVVGLKIVQVAPATVKVTAVSRKRSKMQITGQDWELSLLTGIDTELQH